MRFRLTWLVGPLLLIWFLTPYLKAQEGGRLNHAGIPTLDPPEQPPVPPPFALPFAAPPGPDTWILGQAYGNTVGAYMQRQIFYQAGQGLHFGLDFSAPCGTEVVALSGASFETCHSAPHLHLEIRTNDHNYAYNPDSRQVLFIDKPAPEAPGGIYGLDLADPQGAITLVNEVIGFRNLDRSIVATLEGELIHFVNEITEESWTIDTGGNWPYYSPDNSQVVWVAANSLFL